MGALASIDAPPLNDKGMIELISPSQGTVLLTPDEHAYSPSGTERLVRKGEKIKLRGHRATISLDLWEMVRTHPAYTGEGEPRILFLAAENVMFSTDDGVRVVDGAQSSGTGRIVQPPIRGWNELSYSKLRKAVADGIVRDPAEALAYERLHGKRREGVIRLLAAAIAGTARLPTANQMTSWDRKAGPLDLEDEGDGLDGEDPTQAEPPMPEEGDDEDRVPAAAFRPTALTDEEVAEQVAAALEDIDAPLDDGGDEPIPEGVV